MHVSRQWLFVTAAGAVVFALVIWYGQRDVAPLAAELPTRIAASAPPATPVVSPAAPASAPAVSADNVSRWIAESAGADPQKRAAAITALAGAPRADALPVLRGILMNGEPEVDRKLALTSLRELALAQGDADGAARAAVRQAIYHGDDLMPSAELQETLDVIEESELK